MNKRVFYIILCLFFVQCMHAQPASLLIRLKGEKSGTMIEPVVANFQDISPDRVNDSTLLFTYDLQQPEYLWIKLDSQTRWKTRLWVSPGGTQKELIVNYPEKTALLTNPDEWDMLTSKTDSLNMLNLREEADKISEAYIKKHTDSYLSLWLLTHGVYRDSSAKNVALLEMLSPRIKQYPEYRQGINYHTKRKQPLIGDAFIEFTLKEKDGSVFNTRSINNKWILLQFWQDGCGASKKSIEPLVKWYNTLDRSKVEFISVSIEPRQDTWLNSPYTSKIPWPSVWQEDNSSGELALNYNLEVTPFFILFDKEKRISTFIYGYEEEEVRSVLLAIP